MSQIQYFTCMLCINCSTFFNIITFLSWLPFVTNAHINVTIQTHLAQILQVKSSENVFRQLLKMRTFMFYIFITVGTLIFII